MIDVSTRALLGYVSIPQLQAQLAAGRVTLDDHISSAMARFRRKGAKYTVITMETPLEQLEEFFDGGAANGRDQSKEENRRDFAVVTDVARRFVLGVATRADLEEFTKRRIE